MPRYVFKTRVGSNGIAITAREAETGEVASFTIVPREVGERILRLLEERVPEVKIEYE